MFYYGIFVNNSSYKANVSLTYASDTRLEVGSLVSVPVKNNLCLGFVVDERSKPEFKTKQIGSILDLPPLPMQLIELSKWLLYFYPSSVGVTSQQLMPRKLLVKQHSTIAHTTKFATSDLPVLTDEQKNVLKQINESATYLLHGETGSGKTRIYIELARKTLNQNRSVLVLTPEIGLTPQLAQTFKETFGESNVVVTHSQLTDSQRARIWLQILQATAPLIVIGPRSALFSPLANVGLIVVDESHEPTYKQDQLPHYNSLRVAAKLAALHGAILVLGSATPSITDFFMAKQKQRPTLRMTKPAQVNQDNSSFAIKVVDMKERAQFTKSPYISNELLDAIGKSLGAKQQSLLFLNRRGTARAVLCNNCGWQALCPHCDLPLTYHADIHLLRCHTCGFRQQIMNVCPTCNNADIILKNIGTKFIVDEIATIFPQARIQRFDADNKKADSLEQQYDAVRSGDIDVLIGTQMLAKGLDLPKLTTVGVINADTSLYFPDYTAAERTYQLLRQVIGRVGRGHQAHSTVIVQTYDAQNVILQAAINGNWQDFYDSQLAEREKFMFPPFCFLLKLACRRASSKSAESAAQKLADSLAECGLHIAIDGPTPSFHEKVGNKYQWQLVVKAKDRAELLKVIADLPSGWSYDIDPLNLL